jgi:nucleoside-diphosphate-sugar epimerase
MKVVVTGGSGFVGSAVLDRLAAEGHEPVGAVRGEMRGRGPISFIRAPDLAEAGSWREALSGADAIVHAAARVHVMSGGAYEEYRRVNVEGTLHLAREAAKAGVRRLVFISSIKAQGEATQEGRPFRSDEPPGPVDPYGRSKLEAEQGLFAFGRAEGMEIVSIRPPLVYGPGVRANFRSLMRLLHSGVPLPLASVRARRSLVSVDNLADLVLSCLRHPQAPGKLFLASDGEDLPVPRMLRLLAQALGRQARLVPVPPAMLMSFASLLGKSEQARRLCTPLEIDIRPTIETLGWTPPTTTLEGFQRTARAFVEEKRR